MAFDKLICPNCKCPLTPPVSAAQTQICCPRCDTWLELESRCSGVCLSCHAGSKSTKNTGSCADLSEAPLVRFDKSDKEKEPEAEKAKNKEDSSGLKALFKKVFHV